MWGHTVSQQTLLANKVYVHLSYEYVFKPYKRQSCKNGVYKVSRGTKLINALLTPSLSYRRGTVKIFLKGRPIYGSLDVQDIQIIVCCAIFS